MTRNVGVALIGGGRWTRVIGDMLDTLVPSGAPAVVVSPSNPEGWAGWVEDHLRWQIGDSLESVLNQPEITHVVIARRARDHAATCLAALAQGKAVLVEKPFCLTLAEANALLGASLGAEVGTALVFHFGRNQAAFRRACLARGPLTHLRLDWADPATEQRHGQSKTYDASLNVVQDVLPHAWSILRPFFADAPLELCDVGASGGGRDVTLNLAAGAVPVSIRMQREAERRIRRVLVEGVGWQGDFNFSIEPGQATLDGQDLNVAEGFTSPLAAELQAFLADELPPLIRLSAAQEAIRLSVAAVAGLRPLQAKAIAAGNGPTASPDDRQSAQYALKEISAGGVMGDGHGTSEEAISAWAAKQVPSPQA